MWMVNVAQGWCPMCERYFGGWWMGGMMIVWVVLLIGGVWLVMWLARRGSVTGSDSPEDILRQRYARGEIDRPTFERMMDDLRGGGPRT